MSLTPKIAKEILKPLEPFHEIPFYGMGEAHRVLEAHAFMEGYSYREKEIEGLVEALGNHFSDRCMFPSPPCGTCEDCIDKKWIKEALEKFRKGGV